MQKKTITMRAVFLLFLLAAAAVSAQQAVFQTVEGKVEYRASNSASWRPASVGDVIPQGGSVSTGFNSRAVIALGDDSLVTARALTRLTLSELLAQEGTVNTDLFLDVGGLRAEVNSSEGISHDFTIRSTQSTASVRGTIIEGDGSSWKTERGELWVSNDLGQKVTVTRGQSTTVTAKAPPPPPQVAMQRAAVVLTAPKPPRAVPVLAHRPPLQAPPEIPPELLAKILESLVLIDIRVEWP